jgi:hypothetical protein
MSNEGGRRRGEGEVDGIEVRGEVVPVVETVDVVEKGMF